MRRPVIILGAGGHAKVLIDILKSQSFTILGISDPGYPQKTKKVLNVPVIANDDSIFDYSPDSVYLVNSLGVIDRSDRRREIFNKFKNKGYKFASVIHSSAILSPYAEISEGTQIMAGAIIQTGSIIGTNTIINTGAVIDHDTFVGSHVHIAPGATVSGGVKIDDGTLIGAGSTIIQGIKIGTNCIIAAGSVVVRDIPDGTKVIGVPAKVVN